MVYMVCHVLLNIFQHPSQIILKIIAWATTPETDCYDTIQLCLRRMVDFVHRFCIRSVKTLCYACSGVVMVLFSSSVLRKFLVFCGLVKVLGPWCTINFRLVQFVNI